MTVEIKEKGSPEFYREVVCVAAQFKDLQKKPERKFRNSFLVYKGYLAFGGFLIVAFLINLIRNRQYVLSTAGIMLGAFLVLLSFIMLKNMNKMLAEYLANAGHSSTFTVDETGVELVRESAVATRMSWDSIAFCRVFPESVCFLPREMSGLILAVTHEHKDVILEAIRELDNPDIKVIQ